MHESKTQRYVLQLSYVTKHKKNQFWQNKRGYFTTRTYKPAVVVNLLPLQSFKKNLFYSINVKLK